MQRPSFRIIVFLLFCAFLAAFAWYGARWAERLPGQVAAAVETVLEKKALELREKFFSIAHFEPRVLVRQKVIAESQVEIAEVAVMEKDIEVERELVHTWAGSTKRLRLRGQFRVKIGFNLLDRFEIQVEKGHRRILLPPADILSVEPSGVKVDAYENGFWNPISADDVQEAITSLQALARSQSQPLILQAQANFGARLQKISDAPLELIVLPPGKS